MPRHVSTQFSFSRLFVFLRSFVPSRPRSFVPSCHRAVVQSCFRSSVPSFFRAFVSSRRRVVVPSRLRSFVLSRLRSFVQSCSRDFFILTITPGKNGLHVALHAWFLPHSKLSDGALNTEDKFTQSGSCRTGLQICRS